MSETNSRYYLYQVLDAEGRTRTGLNKLTASDNWEARLMVERQRQSTVLSLLAMPAVLGPFFDLFFLLSQRAIPLPLLAEFLHNLGLMLKSGLPVDAALSDLASDAGQNKSLQQLISELLTAVRGGNSLSSVFALQQQRVPITVRSLITIGERSGNLDKVLLDAASHLNRLVALRQDALKALIYPAFVMLTIIGSSLFWVYYVLPDLADMFRQMGASLPPLTRSVIAWVHLCREVLAEHGQSLLLGSVLIVFLILRVERFRAVLYWLAYHLPVSRVLVRTSAMAFITEYLALLTSAGINLLESLDILEGAVRNGIYRQAIRKVHAGIVRGNSLSHELARTGVFPPLMVRLVGVGEQSGTLDRQLYTLSEEYRRRLNHTISTLAEIIKPVVLLLAGGLFIFVVVVFLLPVYDLIAQSAKLS